MATIKTKQNKFFFKNQKVTSVVEDVEELEPGALLVRVYNVAAAKGKSKHRITI